MVLEFSESVPDQSGLFAVGLVQFWSDEAFVQVEGKVSERDLFQSSKGFEGDDGQEKD